MSDTEAWVLAGRARPLAQYPHARRVGELLFISGLSSRRADDSHAGVETLEDGTVLLDIGEQTHACIENMRVILETAGLSLAHVVDLTCFLTSMDDYAGFNQAYNEYFTAQDGPTRTTMAVAALPHPNLLIELKAIARFPEGFEAPTVTPVTPSGIAGREEAPWLDSKGLSPSWDPLDALAESLRQAEMSREGCSPLTEVCPGLSVAEAYEIQRRNVARRVGAAPRAARIVGHKIGITSEAVQAWLEVDEPDFGHLLADMAVVDGGKIEASDFLQPKAEGELALVLGQPLRGPGLTVADLISAIAYGLPAIEIIDSRVADWKIRYEDTIADNASSAMFVLGSRPMRLDRDLSVMGMTLRKNGRVASTGAGAASMGHPFNAALWLVNTLGALGQELPAGSIILSGALGPVVSIEAGDHVEVILGEADRVSVRVV